MVFERKGIEAIFIMIINLIVLILAYIVIAELVFIVGTMVIGWCLYHIKR